MRSDNVLLSHKRTLILSFPENAGDAIVKHNQLRTDDVGNDVTELDAGSIVIQIIALIFNLAI